MTEKAAWIDYDVAVSLRAFSRQKLCELARHDPAHGPEIWCQFGVKDRPEGRFFRFCRFLSLYTSTT